MSRYLKNQSVKQRTHRRRRMRRLVGLMKSWVKRFSVALIFLVIVGSAYHGVTHYAVFAVDRVVVRGDLRALNEASIREVAGIKLGTTLFAHSLENMHERLIAHPWIREVAVRRKLPNYIWIYVVEREPQALLNLPDGLHFVDQGGEVFKVMQPGEVQDLPLITGVTDVVFDSLGVGHSVQLLHLFELYRTYIQHPLAELTGCSEIVRDPLGRLSVVTEQPVMRLHLGKEPGAHQFDRLYSIWPTVTRGEHTLSSVDLYIDRKVVVRHAS